MIDVIIIGLFSMQCGLLFVIALLVADNNRIARERQYAKIEAAWCRSIVDAFVGKTEVPN